VKGKGVPERERDASQKTSTTKETGKGTVYLRELKKEHPVRGKRLLGVRLKKDLFGWGPDAPDRRM